ncbi:Separin [Chamberlinius hualienensis]
MEHQKVLDEIKSQKWIKAAQYIKNYLSTVRASPDEKENLKNFTKNLIKCVAVTVDKLKNVDCADNEIAVLVDSVFACYDLCFVNENDSSSSRIYDLLIARWLYGIFYFFIKQENKDGSRIMRYFDYLKGELALCRQSSLLDNEQKTLEVLLKNSNYYLCVTAQKFDENHCQTSLELRERAIDCLTIWPDKFVEFCQLSLGTVTICHRNEGQIGCQTLKDFYRKIVNLIKKLISVNKDLACVVAALNFMESWIFYLLFSNEYSKSEQISEINQLRTVYHFDDESKSNLEIGWNFYMDVASLMAVVYSFNQEKKTPKKETDKLLKSCTNFLQKDKIDKRIITQSAQLIIKSLTKFLTVETVNTRSDANVIATIDIIKHLLEKCVNSGAGIILEIINCLNKFWLFCNSNLKAQLLKDLTVCLSVVSNLTGLFGQFVDIPQSEIKRIVDLVWNFITIAYRSKHYEDVCKLFQHIIIITKDGDSELLTMIQLESKIRYYVESLCKCRRFSTALHYIAQVIALNYDDLRILFDLWRRVKRMAKESKDEDATKITMDIVRNYLKNDSKIDVKVLLKTEVEVYKDYSEKNNYDFGNEIFVALESLCKNSRGYSIDEAAALMAMAKLLLSLSVLHGNPLELCERAIRLLEAERKLGQHAPAVDFYLARALFCRYEIKSKERQKLSTVKVEKAKNLTKKSSEDRNESEKRIFNEILPTHEHITYHLDLEDARGLNEIVTLLSSAISSKYNEMPNKEECLDDLIAIAEIFCLKCMVNEELKTWRLAYMVAKESTAWLKFCYVSCRITDILLHFGLTNRAEVFLTELKLHVENINDSTDSNLMKACASLCESELLLTKNKVLDGWMVLKAASETLEETTSLINDSKRRKWALLLDCERCQLLSKYCELPYSLLPLDNRGQDTAFYAANIAFKTAISLSIIENEYFKSRIFNVLFNTALHLARMLLDLGAPKEAWWCLNEPLIWAHKLCLSLRTAEILLVLAKIEVSCGEFKSCLTYLDAINYILDSKGTSLSFSETQSNDDDTDTSESCDDFFCVPVDEIDPVCLDSVERDLRLSPVLRIDYDSLKHSYKCKCEKCGNLVFHHFCLNHSIVQAQCLILQPDQLKAAICILTEKLDDMNRLYKVEESITFEIYKLSYISEPVPRGNKVFKEANIHYLLQLVKFDMSCNLATMHLRDNNFDEAHAVVKSVYEEANKLFCLGMQKTHVIVSSIKYLYCVVKIILRAKKENRRPTELFNGSWEFSSIPIEFDEDIDFLQTKASQMSLKDDIVTGFKTPKPERRGKRIENCNAPLRKGPILSVWMNKFSDDDVVANEKTLDACSQNSSDKVNIENINVGKKTMKSKQSDDTKRSTRTKSVHKAPAEISDNGITLVEECTFNEDLRKPNKNVISSKPPNSGTGFTGAKFIPLLESAIHSIAHLPTYPLYRDLHVLLALCKGQNSFDKASHLAESLGVTLRHQTNLALSHKIKNGATEEEPCESMKVNEVCMEHLTFKKYDGRIVEFCRQLPKDFIVCQINIVPSVLSLKKIHSNPELIITRLEHKCQPLVIKTNIGDSPGVSDVLSEFRNIIETHSLSHRLTDKIVWSKRRSETNDRLKVFLASMENVWLGYWKGLLLGGPIHEDDIEKLKIVVKKILTKLLKYGYDQINQRVLKLFIDSLPWLNNSQVRQGLAAILNTSVDDGQLTACIQIVQQEAKSLCSKTFSRKKAVFILDREFHNLPWENMPIVADMAVTRMPSIHFVQSHLTRYSHPKAVDTSNAYFVLNPDDNLPRTQEKFSQFFADLDWSGVAKRRPTTDEWLSALTKHELFIYCGHGSGIQYINGKSLKDLACKSTIILAGCSSVKLQTFSHFEPFGVPYRYLACGSPCVLGTLWNVGDIEIDLALKALLNRFIQSSDVKKTLSQAVIPARFACKLQYITGATIVIYGMPVVAS